MKSELSNNDIEVFFTLLTLLYVDDTIIVVENATYLHCALSRVKTYCNYCILFLMQIRLRSSFYQGVRLGINLLRLSVMILLKWLKISPIM